MAEHHIINPNGGNGNGNGNSSWKNAALHVMWAILVAIMGWFMTEGRADRERIRVDAQRVEQSQGDDRQRIAVLETEMRYMSDALARIENGVERLQRDRR